MGTTIARRDERPPACKGPVRGDIYTREHIHTILDRRESGLATEESTQ